eukprot:evm.model.scf_363.3 EVM.evm.TU.scf_363.3   scf_363:28211-29065(-)
MPFDLLNALLAAAGEHQEASQLNKLVNSSRDGAPLLKKMRLVNRHWHKWATGTLNYLSIYASRKRREKVLLAAMHRFPQVQVVRLRFVATPRELLLLRGFPRLTYIDAAMQTDDQLAALQALTHLRGLWTLESFKQITDSGLRHLSHLTNLETLNLRYSHKLTGIGLHSLSTLTALVDLNLCRCISLTDAGLRALCPLTCLMRLNLNWCVEITDAGVASLQPLKALVMLSLNHCSRVTDNGISMLTALSSLRDLRVAGNDRITEAGLCALSTLPKLSILRLVYA